VHHWQGVPMTVTTAPLRRGLFAAFAGSAIGGAAAQW